MWTVVFCPKVGFYLGNVDTKIQLFYFGVHITKAQKNSVHRKCPHNQYGHFLVDSSLQWTAVVMILLWTLDLHVDTFLWTFSLQWPS